MRGGLSFTWIEGLWLAQTPPSLPLRWLLQTKLASEVSRFRDSCHVFPVAPKKRLNSMTQGTVRYRHTITSKWSDYWRFCDDHVTILLTKLSSKSSFKPEFDMARCCREASSSTRSVSLKNRGSLSYLEMVIQVPGILGVGWKTRFLLGSIGRVWDCDESHLK